MIRNSSHSLVLTVQVQVYLPWGNEYLPIKGAEIIYLDYIFDHHFLMVLREQPHWWVWGELDHTVHHGYFTL